MRHLKKMLRVMNEVGHAASSERIFRKRSRSFAVGGADERAGKYMAVS